MPEPILLLAALLVAGWLVLRPLWSAAPPPDGDRAADDDGAAVRYQVALEALRDVEADRRAGTLDDAAYAEQLAEAEARAAAARAALAERPAPAPARAAGAARRAALLVAGAIAAVLLAGWFVPPAGIANRTEINESLAAAQEAEAARQQRIAELRLALAADPTDPATLSELADAHLAGTSGEDLVRAAVALQLLIQLEPQRADAYERIITAYIRADDYVNARAAYDAYAEIGAADPVELAFFDGIIALRGEQDAERAIAAFDRFLELAPDDGRESMIRGLRDEAAAGS